MSCFPFNLFKKRKQKSQEQQANKLNSGSSKEILFDPKDGVNLLLDAEKRARQTINSAKQRKTDLMKRAKDAALFENMELSRKYKHKIDKDYLSLQKTREIKAMQMENEIATQISDLNSHVVKHYDQAQKLLFEKTIFIDLLRYINKNEKKSSTTNLMIPKISLAIKASSSKRINNQQSFKKSRSSLRNAHKGSNESKNSNFEYTGAQISMAVKTSSTSISEKPSIYHSTEFHN